MLMIIYTELRFFNIEYFQRIATFQQVIEGFPKCFSLLSDRQSQVQTLYGQSRNLLHGHFPQASTIFPLKRLCSRQQRCRGKRVQLPIIGMARHTGYTLMLNEVFLRLILRLFEKHKE